MRLVQQMKAGQVDVLVIHDANPIYSLPTAAGFAEALKKVGTVISTATLPDETSVQADWILPQSTSLESWGDAEPRPGIRSIVQPTLRPLHDTKSLGDIFLDSGRAQGGRVASTMPEGSFVRSCRQRGRTPTFAKHWHAVAFSTLRLLQR